MCSDGLHWGLSVGIVHPDAAPLEAELAEWNALVGVRRSCVRHRTSSGVRWRCWLRSFYVSGKVQPRLQ